jgi:dTDP-4-amino-4,6-dideoxygalactose transaminase
MAIHVPFHRPHFTGHELRNLEKLCSGHEIASDGSFSKECTAKLESRLNSREILMTTSCTGALELAARLLELGPGDEVIMPSFAFSSIANAVLLTGAKPVFVDIRSDTCNLDEAEVEAAITPRTKAIFVLHYAGVACEMNALNEIARRQSLALVEDAAQAVGASYNGQPLGTIGQLGAYSFHYTKNWHCGEGGALSVNEAAFSHRAHAVREKGTNRRAFFLGEVDKYSWVDVGLSLPPSELCCAFLASQLDAIDYVIHERRKLYERYMLGLEPIARAGHIQLPNVPEEALSNFHLFHIIVADGQDRANLMTYLSKLGIQTAFHYFPLHLAPMGTKFRSIGSLPVTSRVGSTLLRLPLFVGLRLEEQDAVIDGIMKYYAIQSMGK